MKRQTIIDLSNGIRWENEHLVNRALDQEEIDLTYDDSSFFNSAVDVGNVRILSKLINYFLSHYQPEYVFDKTIPKDLLVRKKLQDILEFAKEEVKLSDEMEELLSKYTYRDETIEDYIPNGMEETINQAGEEEIELWNNFKSDFEKQQDVVVDILDKTDLNLEDLYSQYKLCGSDIFLYHSGALSESNRIRIDVLIGAHDDKYSDDNDNEFEESEDDIHNTDFQKSNGNLTQFSLDEKMKNFQESLRISDNEEEQDLSSFELNNEHSSSDDSVDISGGIDIDTKIDSAETE